MLSKLAADLVLLAHFGFIVFVVFGGLLVYRWPKVIWLHLPAAAWGALVEFAGYVCPLTPLEVRLRMAAGAGDYSGGFIDQYLMPVIYPAGLNRDLQVVLGVSVVLFNCLIYGGLAFRRNRNETSA